jgi:hypothetical protein
MKFIVAAKNRFTQQNSYISEEFLSKKECERFIKHRIKQDKNTLPGYVAFSDYWVVEIAQKCNNIDLLQSEIEPICERFNYSSIIEAVIENSQSNGTPLDIQQIKSICVDYLDSNGYFVYPVATQKEMDKINDFVETNF